MLIQTQPAQSYSTHMVPASHHLVRQTNNNGTAVDMVTYSNLVNGSIFSIPKSWSKESQEDMLLTVYSFIKTFVGASGAGQGTIDNRIEQAMDLVKSHLMSAVRSEVEELRDRITKLEETNNVLYRENEVLRANVNPDVLASISGRQQQSLQPPDPQQPGQH